MQLPRSSGLPQSKAAESIGNSPQPHNQNMSEKEIEPIRIQRKRTKGWRMPENTVSVCRPGKWGNPFKIGGYFMVGDPDPRARFRMSWCQSYLGAEGGRFTLIETAEVAVDFFRRLCANGYYTPKNLAELRGKNLACYCPLDQPCHADVLLEIANRHPTATPPDR